MDSNKYLQYSFYVPQKDTRLSAFLDSQTNQSLSIRLILNAFISNLAQEGIDVAVMDLNDLIKAAKIDTSKIAVEETAKNPEKPVVRKAEKTQNTIPEKKEEKKEEEVITPEYEEESEEEIVPNIQPESEPESEPEEETPNVETYTEDDDEEEIVPEVEVEPEVPKKVLNSTRESYNEGQNAKKDASMDDIMALLGDNE